MAALLAPAAVLAQDPPAGDEPASDEPAEDGPVGQEPADAEPIVEAMAGAEAVADAVSGVADLLGHDGVSREAANLGRVLAAGQEYAELAMLLYAANTPTGLSWQLVATASGGGEKAPTRSEAAEVSFAAGLIITGRKCNLLDASAQISMTMPSGLGLSQVARACLDGVRMDEEPSVEWFHLKAFEAAGLNVRPALDAAALVGSARYSRVEFGLEGEGLRWHYREGERSLALLDIRMTQGWLRQSIAGDRRSIATFDADVWVGEWRFHRPASALTDATIRLFDMEFNTVESGEAVVVARLAPGSLNGIGFAGVYFDLIGGIELTADEIGEDGQPINQSELPDLAAGTWRAALYAGAPWFHIGAVSQRRLSATLTADLVIEERTSAFIHFNRGPLYLDANAFVAQNDIYLDADTDVDSQAETWGVDALLALRIGRRATVGASLEIGRSFYFAPAGDSLDTPPDPEFGWRALLTTSYRYGRARAL